MKIMIMNIIMWFIMVIVKMFIITLQVAWFLVTLPFKLLFSRK